MYSEVSDMLTKIGNGQMTPSDIPVYREDINTILPNLALPGVSIVDILNTGSSSSYGSSLNLFEQGISSLVGSDNAKGVFNNLKEKGMFKVSVDLGYNVASDKGDNGANGMTTYKRSVDLQRDGSLAASGNTSNTQDIQGTQMNLPFDSLTPGMDDNAANASPSLQASRFDWKNRAQAICNQVKLRGLDPLDFGCIAKDSLTSPAYSWRGHTKMVCGRLGATIDPDLPIACGCPPQKWKGWTLSV